jgi:NAD(P)-dependent dehydrogenase (short-subunit alcohol dehydrogenase family)
MRKNGGGAIINFATGSIRGFTGKTTSAARLAYVSAKAGIIGLTNQLSQDVAVAGIAVNAIQPGFVLTEPGARIREIFDSMSAEDQQAMLARRKPRTTEEIAWAVAWMAARPQSDLSGVSVRLHGPIDGPDLRLKMDETNPLATTAQLERL